MAVPQRHVYFVGRAMGGHRYPASCPRSALQRSVGVPQGRLGGSPASLGSECQGAQSRNCYLGDACPLGPTALGPSPHVAGRQSNFVGRWHTNFFARPWRRISRAHSAGKYASRQKKHVCVFVGFLLIPSISFLFETHKLFYFSNTQTFF